MSKKNPKGTSTITTNWRVTIPPEEREGLEIGDLVLVKVQKAKVVVNGKESE